MGKKKKVAVKVSKQPQSRDTNMILTDTGADPVLLDITAKDKTTEEAFNHVAPQGSTRNDLTITFRYNFDRISELKERALRETKKNWEEDEGKDNKRRAVQYTDLMRRAIDEAYFGG